MMASTAQKEDKRLADQPNLQFPFVSTAMLLLLLCRWANTLKGRSGEIAYEILVALTSMLPAGMVYCVCLDARFEQKEGEAWPPDWPHTDLTLTSVAGTIPANELVARVPALDRAEYRIPP